MTRKTTPHGERVLFLCLKPHWADLVLSGQKTVEFRKRAPRTEAGTFALIYSSSPEMALVGTCTIGHITEGAPQAIWRRYGRDSGASQQSFYQYVGESKNAVAITLQAVRPLHRPIALGQIRLTWRNFQPPQSFGYVEKNKTMKLLGE